MCRTILKLYDEFDPGLAEKLRPELIALDYLEPDYSGIYSETVAGSTDFGLVVTGCNTLQYSEEEIARHVEIMEEFCEDSLRLLNDNGLLTPGMRSREKAAVILSWVDYYLDCDHTLEIHSAGVAVQERLGVCESYQALYQRICVLAGIPSYGQSGGAYSGEAADAHIWSVQLDENGSVFYTGPTWADFSEHWGINTRNDVTDPQEVFALFLKQYGREGWTENKYFWQTGLWPDRYPELDELFPNIPDVAE